MGKEPREFIKNLEIGKTYILVWFNFVFIGILKDKTWRTAYKLEWFTNDKGKPEERRVDLGNQYEVLIFESDIEPGSNYSDLSKYGIVTKLFHKENSKTQLYCTNSIIFENNILDGKYYDWFVKKMESVNISKVNGKNTIVNTEITKSMIIKDLSRILRKRELNLFEQILNSKGTQLVQNYQKKYEGIALSQNNQLPFEEFFFEQKNTKEKPIQKEAYIKYSRHIILPSFNLYKMESYCLLDNLEDYVNNSMKDTVCFVIDSIPRLMIFNETLFNISLEYGDANNGAKEVIMLMKQIEKEKGVIEKI
jgi:hypothetical protein